MTSKEKELINMLVESFSSFALADIKHNVNKPIAAFILSVCFIDQLASFRYLKKMTLTDRWEKFVDDYMPMYSGLNIYKYFRNTLIHNYSSKGKFALTNDESFLKPATYLAGRTVINTNIFIRNLEIAFENLIKDFEIDGSEAQIRAIAWSKSHPILKQEEVI